MKKRLKHHHQIKYKHNSAFLKRYLHSKKDTQFSSAHFASFLDIVLYRGIEQLDIDFKVFQDFSTVICKLGDFSKLPLNRKFLTEFKCSLDWADMLADSTLQFGVLSNVVHLTVDIGSRLTNCSLSQVGMLRLLGLTFRGEKSIDREQTILRIFINPSLDTCHLNELWKYQFAPDALQPICQTLTEFFYELAADDLNLVAFILRHATNFQLFSLYSEYAPSTIHQNVISDALIKISSCSETDTDIKTVSKMPFKGALSPNKLPIKIKNNEEYEAIASISPMLEHIEFSAVKCDPAIIGIISKKYPWTDLSRVSFEDCPDEFIKEFLRVFSAQIRNLQFYDQFDCEMLYNVSVDTSSKIPLIPRLNTLKCCGTMIGVPPKSVDHLSVFDWRSFESADEWRTIDQVLPNLIELKIHNCHGLTGALVKEIFPKLSYLTRLSLSPRFCDGYDLELAWEGLAKAGISLSSPRMKKCFF